MIELILAACLTSSCPGPLLGNAPALEPAPGSNAAVIQEKTASKDIFPAPRTGITLHVGDSGPQMSMFDLCVAYAEVTGQRFTYGDDTASLLKQQKVQLDRSLDVEPEDLQRVFETMMISSDFVIIPMFDGPTPIFKVASLQTAGRSNLRSSAIEVASEDFEIIERHPAVLFTTTIHLPNLDVRQVSNSMRTMITDANTQQMLPAGTSNSMVLVGFGSQIADLRSLMVRIDEAAGANAEAMKPTVDVLAIEHADADDLAKIVALVFGANPTDDGQRLGRMIVLADSRTNSLVLRGTADQIARAKDLVVQLDREVKGKK